MNVFGFVAPKFDRIFVLQLEKLNLETILMDICVCIIYTRTELLEIFHVIYGNVPLEILSIH